jgi:hypothetical protein
MSVESKFGTPMGEGDAMTDRKTLKEIIGGFTSREEEADFWDTADLSRFEDEFEPVELRVSPDLRHVFGIAFDGDQTRRLTAIARRQHASLIPLMRSWILEALERTERKATDEAVSRASAN